MCPLNQPIVETSNVGKSSGAITNMLFIMQLASVALEPMALRFGSIALWVNRGETGNYTCVLLNTSHHPTVSHSGASIIVR